MTNPVQMAKLRLRRPRASERWPVTGATAATSTPPTALEMASQVAPLNESGGRSRATTSVRYGAKTKLTTMVL